jgi:hypothetical protein
MTYRNIDFIQQEAFCLYLHKTLSKALNDEDRNQHFRKDYEYFKKTCILFHQDNNNKLIFTFYVDCNGGGMQEQSVEQTDVGLLLLKEIKIADKINNIEGIDLKFQFSKLNNLTTEDIQGYCSTTLSREFKYNIQDNYKYVSFYFEDIKKHFQKEIEEFEYNANLVLSVKEHSYLGEFCNLKGRIGRFPIENIENRICAYIDILGFKNLIYAFDEYAKNRDNKIFTKIYPFSIYKLTKGQCGYIIDTASFVWSILNCQYNIISQYLLGYCDVSGDVDYTDFYSALKVSLFSDTIVLSFGNFDNMDDQTKIKNIKFFLETVQSIQTNLLMSQMLTRGAITYGGMYHYGTMYGGKTFIKAYELGDKDNRLPIVKIDESINDIFAKTAERKLEDILLNDGRYLCNDYLEGLVLNIKKPIYNNNDPFYLFYSDEWLKFCCNHEGYTKDIRKKYKYLCRIFNLSLS